MEETIKNFRQEGKSIREIARILGCSNYTVSKYCQSEPNQVGQQIIELRKQGLSLKKIAQTLSCSKSTVSKWIHSVPNNRDIKVENIDKFKQSRKPKPRIKNSGPKPINNYRQWKKDVRHKRKKFLCDDLGGKCSICGYNETLDALCFHHVEPHNKLFDISGTNLEKNIDSIIREVEKCVIVCSNCHIEIHAGMHHNLTPCKIKSPIPDELKDFKPIGLTKDVIDREYHWLRCKKVPDRSGKEREKSDFDLSKIVTNEINKKLFDQVLNSYHYLGQSNKGHVCRIGFFYGDLVVGVALVTNPVRKTFDGTCEISRFCLCFEQKNLASKCLSLILRYVKSNYDYRFIQAFSQDDIHLGTIYRAANFRESGSSKRSYNYDGIHKKTIYERAKSIGLSEHEYAQKFGLNRISESKKTKFIYELR